MRSTAEAKPTWAIDVEETGPPGMPFASGSSLGSDPAHPRLHGFASRQQAQLGPGSGVARHLTSANIQNTGRETQPPPARVEEPDVAIFISSVVKVTHLSELTPAVPDPSGIAYVPNSNSLVIVDGEVEETIDGITLFAGANLWEVTLDGTLIRTTNISKIPPSAIRMTNEPAGIAFNPNTGHFLIADDDGAQIYDLDPGEDSLPGTVDDRWRSFDTLVYRSDDPEGITYDTWHDRIFVVDGHNTEVFEFKPNGVLINHFDVQHLGIGDPESIEFNPQSGTLFVMSSKKSSRLIAEVTTSGELLQIIDISASGGRTAAGLAYAPASDGSGEMRFYIVDRGIDNDRDPTLADGMLYEMTAPAFDMLPSLENAVLSLQISSQSFILR